MKKYFVIVCIFMAQLAFDSAFAQNKIMVTAHRGDWRNAPENSLRAFEYAAAMGVDMVELDLKKTSDGIIIIMHDETLNRTTNGKGKPGDFTLAEIKQMRLKNGLGRVTNNPIPTLAEVMTALKGSKVMVNLDKSFDYYNEAFAVLKQTGTLKQALFKAEVPYDELKQRYPQLIDSITYMAVVSLDKPEAKKIMTDYLKNMKPYAFELIFTRDTSAIFERITGLSAKPERAFGSIHYGHRLTEAMMTIRQWRKGIKKIAGPGSWRMGRQLYKPTGLNCCWHI